MVAFFQPFCVHWDGFGLSFGDNTGALAPMESYIATPVWLGPPPPPPRNPHIAVVTVQWHWEFSETLTLVGLVVVNTNPPHFVLKIPRFVLEPPAPVLTKKPSFCTEKNHFVLKQPPFPPLSTTLRSAK